MDNFMHHIPTKVYFGEGQIQHLGHELKSFGNRVLLVYGGGSIKKIGVYEEVLKQITKEGLHVVELSGVEPNPKVETVRKGIELCKENDVDVVLAVGGGSSIDCAKAIAAGRYYEGDVWEMISTGKPVEKSIPVLTVLTLAATGSEMNAGCVVSNMNTNQKIGYKLDSNRPKVTIEDPTYTYSVNAYHTAAGIVDIMSHVMEQYFCVDRVGVTNRMAEAILKTCITYGPIALKEPSNYDARANLMWSSSLALNGSLREMRNVGWSVHAIEHQLSAYYDITHGIGLAILTPHWMRHVCNERTIPTFAEYGINVWGIDPTLPKNEIATLAIKKTDEFFHSLNIPMTLREVGITSKEHFEEMAKESSKGFVGIFEPMDANDVLEIYEASY